MESGDLQQMIFNIVKSKIGPQMSAAEEIAKVLNISTDSAYRRMRNEKNISLDELYKLCTYYHISLDQLMNIQSGAFLFYGNLVDSKTFRFDAYLKSVIKDLNYFNSFREKAMYYLCKDMPIFHHFHFREIAAFKRFFWLKTYLQFPEFKHRKFRFEDYPQEMFLEEQKVLDLYNQLPSVELWNVESLNIIIRQIEYYRTSGVFESDKDAFVLYETTEKLIDHLEQQAACGYKFKYDDKSRQALGEFKMYFNEVFLGDNNILVVLDGVKTTMITHSTINYMATRDPVFTENMYKHITNLMKRSTLISSVSERERSRFFRILKEKISHRKAALVY